MWKQGYMFRLYWVIFRPSWFRSIQRISYALLSNAHISNDTCRQLVLLGFFKNLAFKSGQGSTSLLFDGYRGFFFLPEAEPTWAWNLTTDLHLVPWLRISGTIPPLPVCAVMACETFVSDQSWYTITGQHSTRLPVVPCLFMAFGWALWLLLRVWVQTGRVAEWETGRSRIYNLPHSRSSDGSD